MRLFLIMSTRSTVVLINERAWGKLPYMLRYKRISKRGQHYKSAPDSSEFKTEAFFTCGISEQATH